MFWYKNVNSDSMNRVNILKENIQLLPAIAIWLAPIALAASNVTRPMGPAPMIKTFDPMPIPPLLHARTPTDNGSRSAPSSNDTLSGNL